MTGVVDLGQKTLVDSYRYFFPNFVGPMNENGLPQEIPDLSEYFKVLLSEHADTYAVPLARVSIAEKSITVLSDTYGALVRAMAPQQTHLKALGNIVDKELIPFIKASIGTQTIGIALKIIGLFGVMYYSDRPIPRRLFCGLAVLGIGLVAYPILLAPSLFKSEAYLAHLAIAKQLGQR